MGEQISSTNLGYILLDTWYYPKAKHLEPLSRDCENSVRPSDLLEFHTIHIAVVVYPILGGLHVGVGREEHGQLWVVHAAVHVNDTKGIKVLVAYSVGARAFCFSEKTRKILVFIRKIV